MFESLYFGKPVIYPTDTACQEIVNERVHGHKFKNGSIKSLSFQIEKICFDNSFGSPKQLRERALKYDILNQVSKMIIAYIILNDEDFNINKYDILNKDSDGLSRIVCNYLDFLNKKIKIMRY